MKKSISLSILLVALLSTIISVYSMNTTASSENNLLLANIEALTNDEGGSGNWLKGYSMNSINVYVGVSAGITVGVSKSSGTSFGFGVTVEYKQIYCCEKVNQGTDCNKDGNYPECSYLPL